MGSPFLQWPRLITLASSFSSSFSCHRPIPSNYFILRGYLQCFSHPSPSLPSPGALPSWVPPFLMPEPRPQCCNQPPSSPLPSHPTHGYRIHFYKGLFSYHTPAQNSSVAPQCPQSKGLTLLCSAVSLQKSPSSFTTTSLAPAFHGGWARPKPPWGSLSLHPDILTSVLSCYLPASVYIFISPNFWVLQCSNPFQAQLRFPLLPATCPNSGSHSPPPALPPSPDSEPHSSLAVL